MTDKQRTASLAEPAELDRLDAELLDGTAVIFSDCHWMPDEPPSTANRALVQVVKELRPALLVCNGDTLDFPTISSYSRIGWEKRPRVADEVAIVQERLGEIADAAPQAALYWCIGNHDVRFMSYLAQHAGELEGLKGTDLSHHFPEWSMCWSLWLNAESENPVVIKHRWHGGMGAARNNVLKGGVTSVCGHTHALKCWPHSDWRGDRYGVDSGMLASKENRAFRAYTERGCLDWRSGFVTLTIAAGHVMPPELVQVVKESPIPGQGQVWYRGRLWEV